MAVVRPNAPTMTLYSMGRKTKVAEEVHDQHQSNRRESKCCNEVQQQQRYRCAYRVARRVDPR